MVGFGRLVRAVRGGVRLGLLLGLIVAGGGSAWAQWDGEQVPPQPQYPAQPGVPQQPGQPQYPSGPSASQQPGRSGQQGGTKSAGRAARMTYLAGEVHVDAANGTGDEVAALNMPIVEGMIVATGDNGQAEIEFEDGSLVRLTPNSAVSLLRLAIDAKGVYQTRLALLPGLAYMELRASSKYQFSIDAGGDMVSPTENTAVRVDFDEPPAKIAVLDGAIKVVSQAGAVANVTAGQTVREDAASTPVAGQQQGSSGGSGQVSGQQLPTTVYGQGSSGQGYGQAQSNGQPQNQTQGRTASSGQAVGGGRLLVKDSIEPNSWDQWNEDRDQAAADDGANQTAARNGFAGDQGYGWSDLDSNGSWYDVPGQGEVWQPDAAAQSGGDAGGDTGDGGADAFDPYGFGTWVYTPIVGYTWASGYGWGWTPFHCGSWGYTGGFGWGWSPGSTCGQPGYGGRGYRLNLGQVPLPYRPPHKPVTQPGRGHPQVTVHGGLAPSPPPHEVAVTRSFKGHVVDPLPPVGGGYTPRGGSAIGSALLLDAPMNRTTDAPVWGILSVHAAPELSAANISGAVWHPAGGQIGRPVSHLVPVLPRHYSYSPTGRTSASHGASESGQTGTQHPQRQPYTPNGDGAFVRPPMPAGAPVYRTQPDANGTYRPVAPVAPMSPAGRVYAPGGERQVAPQTQRSVPPPSAPRAAPASSGSGHPGV